MGEVTTGSQSFCVASYNLHLFCLISHIYWKERVPSLYTSGLVSRALPTPHLSPHFGHLASWHLGLACIQSPPSPETKCFSMRQMGSRVQSGWTWPPTPAALLSSPYENPVQNSANKPNTGGKKPFSDSNLSSSSLSR